MAKEQDSKRENAPIKRPADVERKSAEAVVAPSGAAPDVESVVQAALQASYGNTLVQAALDGADIEGLGSLIAGEVAAAVGGAGALSEDGAALQAVGNQAMQAAAAAAQRSALSTREALTELRGGGGRPLPTGIRAAMEQAFGASFEHVRVHTNTSEATERLGADAVAMGSHLHFREGAYSPGTREGQSLIAHELTHVMQAMEGRLPNVGGVSTPGMAAEREAYGNESLSMLGSFGAGSADVQFASSVDTSIAPSSLGGVGLGSSPSVGSSFTGGMGSGLGAASMAPVMGAMAPASGGSPLDAATSAPAMLRESDDVDHEETDTEASARHEVEMGLRMGFSLADDMSEGECAVNVPKEGTGRSDGVFTGPSNSGHLAVDEYNAVMRDIGPDGESKASGADENLTDSAQHTETANDGHVHLDESPELGVCPPDEEALGAATRWGPMVQGSPPNWSLREELPEIHSSMMGWKAPGSVNSDVRTGRLPSRETSQFDSQGWPTYPPPRPANAGGPEPGALPTWARRGNAAGARHAKAVADRLESIVGMPGAIESLQGLPITDPRQKSKVITQIVQLPYYLRSQAVNNKILGVTSRQMEVLYSSLPTAVAHTPSGMTFVKSPTTFVLAHETSHHLSGTNDGDSRLMQDLFSLNTEITAAYVDFSIVKLSGSRDFSAAAGYVRGHGSVKHALQRLRSTVAPDAMVDQAAFLAAVTRGRLAESDFSEVFRVPR